MGAFSPLKYKRGDGRYEIPLEYLKVKGMEVMRFWGNEVLFDMEK